MSKTGFIAIRHLSTDSSALKNNPHWWGIEDTRIRLNLCLWVIWEISYAEASPPLFADRNLNIYNVGAEGLVQTGITLKMGTLGSNISKNRLCLCGGDPVVKQGTVPMHHLEEAFCRALALPSFFTSLMALLCQAPSDSTAMGMKAMPKRLHCSQALFQLSVVVNWSICR